jgi:hypothetical protein
VQLSVLALRLRVAGLRVSPRMAAASEACVTDFAGSTVRPAGCAVKILMRGVFVRELATLKAQNRRQQVDLHDFYNRTTRV